MKCHGSGGAQQLTLGRIIGCARSQLDSAWEWLISWVTKAVLLCWHLLRTVAFGGLKWTLWLEWWFITPVLLGQTCLRRSVEARQQLHRGLERRGATRSWRSRLHHDVSHFWAAVKELFCLWQKTRIQFQLESIYAYLFKSILIMEGHLSDQKLLWFSFLEDFIGDIFSLLLSCSK